MKGFQNYNGPIQLMKSVGPIQNVSVFKIAFSLPLGGSRVYELYDVTLWWVR
jgi:hypothetical protein